MEIILILFRYKSIGVSVINEGGPKPVQMNSQKNGKLVHSGSAKSTPFTPDKANTASTTVQLHDQPLPSASGYLQTRCLQAKLHEKRDKGRTMPNISKIRPSSNNNNK